MRKPVFLMLFVLSAGVICLLFFENLVHPSRDSLIQARYVVGSINETIDELEAEKTPPKERWHEIKDLKETVAIDVVCHPSSDQIVDGKTVSEIVNLLQESKYVEVTEYPNREPDVKLYFRKKDGFIMAGRFHVKEGVINSPEGPVIKVDSMAVKKIMDKTNCNQ